MDSYCYRLPKVELHAHLNGSFSTKTLEKLIDLKKEQEAEYEMTTADLTDLTPSNVFALFKVIQELTTTPEALHLATKDVIKDFSDENVVYLELRSTPRKTKHMSRYQYVETMVKAVNECREELPNIVVKLLVSIDRRNGVETASKRFYVHHCHMVIKNFLIS